MDFALKAWKEPRVYLGQNLCKRLHAAIPCADSLVLVYILIVNRHS